MAESILVVGSGGREHALTWALARSPEAGPIYVAPGNAGTARVGTNIAIAADDIPGLLRFAQERAIDLTVVGPESPLAAGIVDAFQAEGLAIFGPRRAAARLEASKAFAKAFMDQLGIPTPASAIFSDYEAALDYVSGQPAGQGLVVKASGLAAGKGVVVCDNRSQARKALRQIMVDRAFGSAGHTVIIEERLSGPEVSVLALSDGQTVRPLAPARDHKRVFDGDRGPNTGGMGAYTPPPDVDDALMAQITRTILEPAIAGMNARANPFVGVLFAGIMLTDTGPQVLEFNCRFGDPETQAVLPLLASDLLALCRACVTGGLDAMPVRFLPGGSVAVVAAAPGYPGTYPLGQAIHGLDRAATLEDTLVFHAGTEQRHGQVVTAGGRVLAVSARGKSLAQAAHRAYAGIDAIHFEGLHARRDIGRDLIAAEQPAAGLSPGR